MSEELSYADGAESEVLRALRTAEDISSGSAELAAKITSWELGYHFSPRRLGLLAPLRLHPGLRAVDLGCGTGVLTRVLGEAGLDVLGIEGTQARAAAAAERCRDLPNVRVVRGEVEQELRDAGPVDLAVLCGVLEYSPLYGNGPEPLLDAVKGALSERGVVALAIENQLGVGYLSGRPEDHHGTAWVGVADYPVGHAAPRTWTRSKLAELLRSAGLTAQRWLLPYPDYKLPRVVLDTSVFDRPDADELVEKLVRDPLSGAFGGGRAAVPGRVLHRMAVAEGFGVEVAPSFLVLAAANEEAIAELTDPGLAWLISGARRPSLRRVRTLGADLALTGKPSDTSSGWLRQHTEAREDWVPGRPLDAMLLDAMHHGDVVELRRLITAWRDICMAAARPLSDEDERHPYLPGHPGVPVLPPDHLDAHPGNMIVGDDGVIVRVDREWLAGTGVDAELTLLRALLEFTREVADSGAPHPWGSEASTLDVLRGLADLAGFGSCVDTRWAELITAEAEFQELVSGSPAAQTAAALRSESVAPGKRYLWEFPGGWPQLADERVRREQLEHELRLATDVIGERDQALLRAQTHNESLANELSERGQELTVARAEALRLDRRLGMVFAELADAALEAQAADVERSRSAELLDRLARTRHRLDTLEASKLVRSAHRYLWPAARLARGARDLLLGRPGDEPDAVLRHSGRLAGILGSRIRTAAKPARESGLHFGVHVPSEPVTVGAGQVIELDGWAVHAGVGVKDVRVLHGGQWHRTSTGHAQPDVAASLRAAGVRAPEGSGFRIRLTIEPVAAPTEQPLVLGVELADGTLLRRELDPLRLVPKENRPVNTRWHGTGPKVAICMATYQPDPKFLAAQLDSLRGQTHTNWCCVISDDNSGAASQQTIRELIDGDERFVLVEHEDNVGFYRNFERALTLAPTDSDAVAMCDQDDVWDPEKLTVLLDKFADPDVQLVYSDMRLVNEQDQVLANSFWRERRNQWTDLPSLLLLNTVTGASSLVRGDLVRERVLPFPPGTPSAFHDHWVASCALANGRLEFIGRPLYSYRQHGDAVTGRRDNRLDEGLPGVLGLTRLALGHSGMLTEHQHNHLEAVAEFELRRVAQYASTLLLRNSDRLTPEARRRIVELSAVDTRLIPLVKLAAKAGGGRPETAGAERYLLSAALRWNALRKPRSKIPPLPPQSID